MTLMCRYKSCVHRVISRGRRQRRTEKDTGIISFSNLEKKEKTRMVQDGNWLGREENRRTALFMETKEKKRFIGKQLSQQWRTRKEDQKKWIS